MERRTQKQSEIRLREEEIAVIDDLIKFIDRYQSKHSSSSPSTSTNTFLLPQSINDQSTHIDKDRHKLEKNFLEGFLLKNSSLKEYSSELFQKWTLWEGHCCNLHSMWQWMNILFSHLHWFFLVHISPMNIRLIQLFRRHLHLHHHSSMEMFNQNEYPFEKKIH